MSPEIIDGAFTVNNCQVCIISQNKLSNYGMKSVNE